MGVFQNQIMAGTSANQGGGYTLWGWGGASPARGINSLTAYNTPQQVGDLDDWTPMVITATNHTHAIKSDGTLWYVGQGGLTTGNGSNATISSPVQIGTATNWYYVGTGHGKGYAVNTSGELWCWGSGSTGCLGQNNKTNESSMVQVAGTTWAAAAGGNDHTLAIKTDGTIWGWGVGGDGRTWHNTTTNYSSPVQGTAATTWWGATGNPPSGGWENGVETAKKFGGASQAYWSSQVIDSAGKLWGCGWNSLGSYGITGSNNSPRQVGSDTTWTNCSHHAFGGVGINDGTMTNWGGYNFAGELGSGNLTYGAGILVEWDGTATDCSKGSNLYYQATNYTIQGGTIYWCGRGGEGQGGNGSNTAVISSPVQGPSGSDWVKIVGGETHALGVKSA